MDGNYASLFESVADAVPDRPAIVHGEIRATYREIDVRGSRLAAAFAALGVGRDAKVASYLYNCPEYVEGVISTFKLRAIPVNVNYRYVADELEYLLDNADAEILLFHGSLGDRVDAVAEKLPKLRALVQVDDGAPLVMGAVAYEDLIAAHEPAPRIARSGDDMLFLYTGGTTGMPKGVMWGCADLLLGPGTRRVYVALGLEPPTTTAEAGERVREIVERGYAPVQLTASPLMHGAGLGGSLGAMLFGGTTVTLTSRRFDAHELWRAVEAEKVTQISIVGDPFARPMLRALEEAEAQGTPYDLSSLRRISSTGAMWSAPVKEGLQAHGRMVLQDSLASSESLAMGTSITEPGQPPSTARFKVGENARVITEDGREIVPGSGEVGLLATSWPIPRGYYKDPEKTARTFPIIAGKRHAIAGDWATVEADGTITLLGRGSVCINTGGEKVFPEEVEEAIKEHRDVVDCTVVGLPDKQWGEVIAAVVSLRDFSADGDVCSLARERLAAYKVPKHVVVVDEVFRGPAGKADYAWARRTAAERLGVTVDA